MLPVFRPRAIMRYIRNCFHSNTIIRPFELKESDIIKVVTTHIHPSVHRHRLWACGFSSAVATRCRGAARSRPHGHHRPGWCYRSCGAACGSMLYVLVAAIVVVLSCGLVDSKLVLVLFLTIVFLFLVLCVLWFGGWTWYNLSNKSSTDSTNTNEETQRNTVETEQSCTYTANTHEPHVSTEQKKIKGIT